jgi:hypothetical protein
MTTTIYALNKVLKFFINESIDVTGLLNLRNQDLEIIPSLITRELRKFDYELKKYSYTDSSFEEIIENEEYGLIFLKAEDGLFPKYIFFREHQNEDPNNKTKYIDIVFIGTQLQQFTILYNDFTVKTIDPLIRNITKQNYNVYELYEINPIIQKGGNRKICKKCGLPKK